MGMQVTLVDEVRPSKADVPAGVGRTAYRGVQEGLTSAREHAPSMQTVAMVTGSRQEN